MKNKMAYILLGLAVLSIFQAVVIAQPIIQPPELPSPPPPSYTVPPPPRTPKLEISPREEYVKLDLLPPVHISNKFILDKVEAGQAYEYEIKLGNTGNKPLIINPFLRSHAPLSIPAHYHILIEEDVEIDAPEEIDAHSDVTIKIKINVPEDIKAAFGMLCLNISDPTLSDQDVNIRLKVKEKEEPAFGTFLIVGLSALTLLLILAIFKRRSRKYIPTMIAVLVLLSMIFIGQHIPFSTHDYDRIVSDQKGDAPVDIDLISLSSLSFADENKLFVALRVDGKIVDDARYDIGIYTKRRSKTAGMGDIAPITPLYLIMDGRKMDIRLPEAVVAYQNWNLKAMRFFSDGSEEIRGVEIEGIGTDTLIFSIPFEPFEGKELYWISASSRSEKGFQEDFCSGTTWVSYCSPMFSLFGILGLVAIALWRLSKRMLAIFLGFAIPFLAFTSFGYLSEAVALATYPSYRISETDLLSGLGTYLGITTGIFVAVIMTIAVAVYTAYIKKRGKGKITGE